MSVNVTKMSVPDSISPGGTRRYNLDKIVAISGKEIPVEADDRYTVAYASLFSGNILITIFS